jgi:hypothetical protein
MEHSAVIVRRYARHQIHLLLPLVLALGLLAGCGGDDDVDQPEPTATPVVMTATTPTPAATPTTAVASPTPTAAATPQPTATATVAAAAPQPFHVEVAVEALPDGASFLQIERVSWARFGGTDENASIEGLSLVYQDAGTEACFVGQPKVPVFRDGGTPDGLMSTDIAAPTTINAGDYYLLLPTGMNCKNIGPTRSTSIGFVIYSQEPLPVGTNIPPAVTVDILTKGAAEDLPVGPATLVLERVILEPGTELPLDAVSWMQIFVESGEITLAGEESATVTRELSATVEQPVGEAALAAGDGATLAGRDDTTLSNAASEPASILVATVMTAGAGASLGEPFHVEAVVDALPENSDFMTIERWSWARFGGSQENAVTLGMNLIYQDAGTESCFVTRPDAPVYRAGGTPDGTISTNIGSPTTIDAGDYYAFPPSLGANCRNTGDSTSVTLGGTVYQGGDPGLEDTLPGGLTAEVLTKAAPLALPAGAVKLTLDRVILQPGESLTLPKDGPAQIFIEQGALTLTSVWEGVSITQQIGGAPEQAAAGTTTLPGGTGATIAPESETSVTNTGNSPASVLVFTVVPV